MPVYELFFLSRIRSTCVFVVRFFDVFFFERKRALDFLKIINDFAPSPWFSQLGKFPGVIITRAWMEVFFF